MQALYALYSIIEMVANVIMMLVIIQFIIGLLFATNVVNNRNEFLAAFYSGIDRFLSPILEPIRRRLPATGAIDFSPLVLLVLLNIVLIVLGSVISSL